MAGVGGGGDSPTEARRLIAFGAKLVPGRGRHRSPSGSGQLMNQGAAHGGRCAPVSQDSLFLAVRSCASREMGSGV
jgi:hypothetical protein